MSTQVIPERETTSCEDLFDRWAEVYDSEENPFFLLERQVLEDVLPELYGLDILDAGCGTGRSFAFLKDRKVKSVVGVDSSPAMVRHAATRGMADVLQGSCDAMPVKDESFDVAVASFVFSYVTDLYSAAAEMMRVCRPGATLILSDIHPETARKFGWKRTFRYKNKTVCLPWFLRSIIEVIEVFESAGWSLEVCEERAFTQRESPTFVRAGRSKQLHEMQGFPALFVLRLRKKAENATKINFIDARCAISANDAVAMDLKIEGERVVDATKHRESESTVSLAGMMILPGLINAHDHLEFGLYRRLGRGPYQNASEWAADIRKTCAPEILRQKRVPKEIRVMWGAINNLLCGVTTVCHHDPLLPSMLANDFPVGIVRRMRWAHSLDVETNLCSRANEGDSQAPFIVHAAEGVDASASAEFDQLRSMGLIGPRTVLVHGLALSTDQVSKANHAGTAVILCPSSNQFLFDCVPSPKLVLRLKRLALGSDSPLTADGDLLDEVRYAKCMVGVEARCLYEMVTDASARILDLRNGEGTIAENGAADLIAVADRGLSPAEMLMELSWRDVELVIRKGLVFLASDRVCKKLPDVMRHGLEQISIDGEVRWVHAPVRKLFEQSVDMMHDGALTLTGREVRYVAA